VSVTSTSSDVPESHPPAADHVIAATRQWLEKAVIGLNLCPFAASVYLHNRVRIVVSEQQSTDGLLLELCTELQTLQQADPLVCETTLLIHPQVLTDFGLYNDFLDQGDAAIDALDLVGEIQIASFHPDYQFADCDPTDMQNYSNRSPYPMLHLLRESSISHAVDHHPDIDSIPANNLRTLHTLGLDGWQKLWRVAR
jgi:uncharacterized protein